MYAAVPSAMPTRIQSRAAGASHTLNLVVLALVEAQAEASRCRVVVVGSSSMSARPFVAHFDLRLARARRRGSGCRRAARLPTIERYGESTLNVGDRAGARRLAVLVEHAQRDHRARAAVGDELRGRLVDLGAHRAAAEVHRALGLPDHRAVCVEHARARIRCRRRRGRTPRQRLKPTVFASLNVHAIEVQRVDRRAVDRELDRLAAARAGSRS